MAAILNTVSGTIYDAFNAPLNNVTVQVFDKDLRSEQILGAVVTDSKGFYSVNFDAAQFAFSETKSADVFIHVVVFSNTGTAPVVKVLGESTVYFNIPQRFTLDFKIGNTPVRELNEFDALVQKIKPLTEPQNVAIEDLQETDKFKDISFLASETGEEAAKIALLPIAFMLSVKTRIAADYFYGLFRLQFPTDLNALLLIKSESIANGIRTAITQNIISSKWEPTIDALVQRLNQLATGTLLSETADKSAAFKQILSAALPTPEQQQAFVTVFLAHEKSPEKFWDALSQQTGFTDPKVITGIQSVLKLNLLTNNQPALTTLLFKDQQQNPDLQDIRGFAAYSFDDWHKRITKLVSTGEMKNFPDGIEGTTPEEKAVNYANATTQLLTLLYPTDVFRNRLNRDNSTAFKETKTDLTTFLTKYPNFDLKNNSIHKLFDKLELTGITDKTLLKKELMTINRISKITDDYNHVSILRLEGIDSATAMVNKFTPAQFAEKFAATLSKETAETIYKKAQQIDKLATALTLNIRKDVSVYAINGPTNEVSADYEAMFGDINCDCEHCQSVYSPAAYFVDILNLINQKAPENVFTNLTGRRPDLTEILLTCTNTNTPLPYIDLVNELLENMIAPIPAVVVNGVSTYPHYQTTNTADELLASPEHVNATAYGHLKTATSAFNLPLNLPLEETRLYLDKLGIKRHQLMELFFGKHTDSKYNDLDIATEYLQLSNDELKIFNGTTQMPVALGTVSDFLRDTGLSYIEMLQLLECHFINPTVLATGERSIKIVSTTADQATCKIDNLKLQTGTPQSLLINPFIRLWKKTGWDIFDLDRVFTALDVRNFSADTNQKLIIPLSHISRLKAQFNLSVLNSISLWSNLDTAVYFDHSVDGQPKIPTRYESLFLNKQVSNPLDPDFSNPGGLSGTLAEKSGIIIAAFNLSQKEFDTLNKAPFVNSSLTLPNLSVIFRYALLARTLKLPLDDLITAIVLFGINPFKSNLHSAETLTFIDKIAFIRASGFSISELSSLLGTSPTVSPQPDNNNIVKVLNTLREGLKKINLLDSVGVSPQAQAENKLRNQTSFITETLASTFKTESKIIDLLINSLLKSTVDNTKPAITAFIDTDFIKSEGPLFTIDSSEVVTWVFPDLYKTYLLIKNTWDRISKLLSKLKVSSDEFIYFQRNEAKLNVSGIWNLPVANSNLFPAFENLYNFFLFRKALALPTPDWFKLFDFAIHNGVDAKKNLINALTSLSELASGTIEFLLGNVTNVNDKGILEYVFPSDYLSGAVLLDVIDCANMAAKLGSSADNIAKLTIPATPNGTEENESANIAKSLLKAKYDATTWLNIIQPLSNQLRARKRDALINYILTSSENVWLTFRQKNNITDANSLYAYFLIDVEMDACMITSRIKQAISSVQLFIDRCLMNLEADSVLNEDFTHQWETWRKRYRVWEANRKIFLYPENWIQPELRDDKSPFFKELESKLKQNEITAETAEDALRFYLEKLDSVANLEMVGVYPDDLTGIVHVIGRTQNIPHQYFYTKQIKSLWSAWEKIDLDIEGDHILPVVWNNRLMLFWGVFTEKQVESGGGSTISGPSQDGSMKVSTPPAITFLEMKLTWSEYKNGKWGGKRISKDAIICPIQPFIDGADTGLAIKNHLSLNSAFEGENLVIHLFSKHSEPYPRRQNSVLKSFVFNNCNGSPTITENYINIAAKIPSTLLIDQMRLDSKGYPFSLFNTGLYKDENSNSGDEETVIFKNPFSFYLMPCHHEIEKVKPETFFYSNKENNFYVRSFQGFIKPPLVDASVLTLGASINRNERSPFLPSKLPVAGFSTKAVENSSTNNAFPGTGVITGLELSNFSTFSPIFVGKHYAFQTIYHPYVCELIKTLNTSGIDGLYRNTVLDTDGGLKDGIQNRVEQKIFIGSAYKPTDVVRTPYPMEQVEFNLSGMYSIYNWELFFYIPLLIATRLSQNQKFAEARQWFHYIFDPTRPSTTTSSGVERFWITQPFKTETQNGRLSIEDYLNNATSDLDLQLSNWEQNPFKPHAVARLRISSYMRFTVMQYIDNLIAWGDQLFRQDTLETINEATLLYVLAANLLGKRPDRVSVHAVPEVNSFSTIQGKLDSFSNAKVAIQSFFSLSDVNNETTNDSLLMPQFCIPKNDVLLGYWDTVADRLFKIRHCQNIEGVFQQLPLFEPPIDPALLVRATNAGLNLNSILNDMTASLPSYRFQIMLQKANELCSDVKGLGSELLAALEKNDAEQLSLLRSSHELNMLEFVRDIKVAQIDEAKENLVGIHRSKDVIQKRRDYYASRELMNVYEEVYFASIPLAMIFQNMQIGAQNLAAIGFNGPEVTIGPFTTGATYGGDNIGNALTSAAASYSQAANLFNTIGTMANLFGSYIRRQDDWIFQTQSADLELNQIDKQIAAAEIHLAIAEKELKNHDLQRAQSKEVDDFLKGKFSSEELYTHMVEELTSVYSQSYQLAYNISKKTEKCLQFELGLENTSFINFGYWDSLKKGLLSGEKLQYDLRRLETAYLEQNRREFELTKHISLVMIDPLELVKLRETGQCDINLPEEIFDLDFPGHFFRRIKSVSITLPCVVGPYTTISCTLRLKKNSIRINNDVNNGYTRTTDDDRFTENYIPVIAAIAASNAQNDSGVFELSFRDERYLPFEGAGVISRWSLELFNDTKPDFGKPLRQFDYGTISDAILHIKYSAREDAGLLKNAAITHLRDYLSQDGMTPSLRLFNLRQEFPTQWHRFLNPPNPTIGNIFELELMPGLFRILDSEKTLKVNKIWLLANCTDASNNYNVAMTTPEGTNTFTLVNSSNQPSNQYGSLRFAIKSRQDTPPLAISINPSTLPVKWQLKINRADGGNLQEDEVKDFMLVLGYDWE